MVIRWRPLSGGQDEVNVTAYDAAGAVAFQYSTLVIEAPLGSAEM
jgi:hypothetical protein